MINTIDLLKLYSEYTVTSSAKAEEKQAEENSACYKFLFSEHSLNPSQKGESVRELKIQYSDKEYSYNYRRNNKGKIRRHPSSELHTLACICFTEEIVKAPAFFAHAEEHITKGAQGQEAVRNQEVLYIHNC